jgi:5-hydroxyisourate hydrolase-like protein (transthyretin family)
MKPTILFPALLLLIFFASNCQKTTQAKGKVFNYVSGKPIEGITVEMIGYDGLVGDGGPPERCELSETKTDANGEYQLEVGCTGMDQVEIHVGDYYQQFQSLYFYSTRSSKLKLGKCNEIDFEIDSIDGRLIFQFYNSQNVGDTVYLKLHCNAIGEPFYYCAKGMEQYVEAGATDSQSWWVTANRYVKYYWDTVPFEDFNASHIDSIFCNRNDSTICKITF